MNTESYVKCPVCGQYSVTIDESEGFESRICIKCGFTTHTMLKSDSNQIELFESQQTKLVKALKTYDKSTDAFWYPVTIHIESVGALYPEGTEESYKWSFAKSVPIPVMERLQHPIPGQPDRYYESRLQVDKPLVFDTFEDAYKKFKGINNE